MKTFLEILDRQGKPQSIEVSEDGQCLINLKKWLSLDPLAAEFEGQLRQDQKGTWSLIDNRGSKSLFYRGKFLQRVTLIDGSFFQIGNTFVRVHIKASAKKKVPQSYPVTEKSRPKPEPPVAATWNEKLMNFLMSSRGAFEQKPPTPLYPWEHTLVLRFELGIQTGTEWEISYGPRIFGANSIEFPIWEPSCPAKAFEIARHPVNPQLPWFRTDHSDVVKLNQGTLNEGSLNNGDTISIGMSRLICIY